MPLFLGQWKLLDGELSLRAWIDPQPLTAAGRIAYAWTSSGVAGAGSSRSGQITLNRAGM
jgi:hypothetical protein